MLYLPITQGWIVSRVASRIYLVCALLAIALFGTLVAAFAAGAVSGIRSLADVPLAESVVRVLIFPEVCGAALLTVAMWYFWFTFDRSTWAKKAFWFLPLYFLLPIGPALYYFVVYLRSPDLSSVKASPVTVSIQPDAGAAS
jgi:hypothetical protein